MTPVKRGERRARIQVLRAAMVLTLMAGGAAPVLAAGDIAGTVTDQATATGLGSVTVSVYTVTGAFVQSTVTNGSGAFTVAGLAAGTYYARTSNSLNYVNQLYDGVPCFPSCTATNGTPITVTDGATRSGVNFALVLGGSISGTVTDAVSSLGVSGVPVQIFASSGFVGASSTDANGVFTAGGLSPGTYFARASLDTGNKNYVSQVYGNSTCVYSCSALTGTPIVVAGGATHGGVDFALARGGTITGRISDASTDVGLGDLAGSFMLVYAADGTPASATRVWGPNGSHTIMGLPAGTYYAVGTARGYVDQLYNGLSCPLGVCTVTSGAPLVVTVGATTSGVNFPLALGGSVTGTVTDAGTAAGLASVSVGLYTSTGTLARSGTTNGSGVFTVSGLPTGTYYARTTVPGTLNYVDQLFNGMPCPLGNCTVTNGAPIAVTAGQTTPGVDFALPQGGSITGSVTAAATAAPLPSTGVRVYTSTGSLAKTATTTAAGAFTVTGLPSGTYYARTVVTAGLNYVDQLYDGMPCFPTCAPTSGTPISVTAGQTSAAVNFALASNMTRNGRFTNGTTGWSTYATPDPSYIVSQVTGGVFEYYRVAPPVGTSNQAVIFQNTGVPLAAGAPVVARFDLGNSSSVRKRISVLILDSDFSDLSVCTFWLPPNSPLASYRMTTHTTKAWSNASIYFYAASAGSNGGYYRLGNVSMQFDASQSSTQTECVDPTAPSPTGGPDGPTLLTNGDFGTGLLTPWGTYGTITTQITGGVLEFIKPSSTPPAGVVLQPTAQPMTANQLLTATFQLGNSSSVRKRVTAILHDNDFTDLSACTFWLAAGQPLSDYALKTFTTKAWTNATLSIYPATVGAEQWILLDNATLKQTPSLAISGTECIEPATPPPPVMTLAAPRSPVSPVVAPSAGTVARRAWIPDSGVIASPAGLWEAVAGAGETATLEWADAIDLRDARRARLIVNAWFRAADALASVEVSLDNSTWVTVGALSSSETGQPTLVDLTPYVGNVVRVRFVLDGHDAGDRIDPDVLLLDDLEVEIDVGP